MLGIQFRPDQAVLLESVRHGRGRYPRSGDRRPRVVFTGKVGHDPRNYRVNFDKLGHLLPNFRLEHTLASGVADLHHKLSERGFGRGDLDGVRFVRLRKLREVLPRLQSLRVIGTAPSAITES